MAVNADLKGKAYAPFTYEVGKEKIREYARAVGDENPVYMDDEAAREAGFEGVVAPPMFAVVYCAGATQQAIFDQELGINLMMMVHGEQEFEWHEVVRAGDVITTTASLDDIFEKAGMDFVKIRSESTNQEGKPVVTGLWTLVVRKG